MAIDVVVAGVAIVALLSASIAAYELLLIALLARPIGAFLLVLARFSDE